VNLTANFCHEKLLLYVTSIFTTTTDHLDCQEN